MSEVALLSACNITTGRLDANAAKEDGIYYYFTCAPDPLRIDTYAFDCKAILLAGNNASGNFHCQRYEGKFNAYQRTYVITSKDGYDLNYIYYNILINLKLLKLHSQGSQTKFLTMEMLNQFVIEDLPYERQKKMVAALVSIDNKISLNKSICADLEAMAKQIYDYWFVQFDFPDENGKPYKSSGGKMVWNEELKREIPEGWEVKMLPDVSDLQYGYPLNTDKFCERGQGVIRIRDIIGNTLSAYTTEVVTDSYLTCAGDLLVGMDGNFQMNYWIRDNDIVNQRITRIRKVDFPVMLIKMQIEPYVNSKITKVARSTVGHLGDSDFKEQPILISKGLDLTVFDTILSQIIFARIENQQLTELRDFLLPMLMNGQVKVGNGVTDQENVVRYDFSGDQSRMMVAEESQYGKKKD